MTLEELIKDIHMGYIFDKEAVQKLRVLVESGITAKDIDAARNNDVCNGAETLLCLVCALKHIETVKYLISIGCNVNQKGSYGWTPLKIVT